MATEVSRAIVRLTEGDSINLIERKWFGVPGSCGDGVDAANASLALWNFSGLFLITAVARRRSCSSSTCSCSSTGSGTRSGRRRSLGPGACHSSGSARGCSTTTARTCRRLISGSSRAGATRRRRTAAAAKGGRGQSWTKPQPRATSAGPGRRLSATTTPAWTRASQKFSRFPVTSNLWSHVWSIKYKRK